MAWNDQDKNNQQSNNPWGNKKGGPPDLEEALRQFQKKLAQLFGGGARPVKPSGPTSGQPKGLTGFILIGLLIAVVYLISGVYIVEPAERAVITRFGDYVRTEGPGPHWLPRFIENKTIVNVDEVKTTRHGQEMLTMDENIVNAEISVQYRIGDAQDYLFNVVDPENTLQQVSESALRAVVGQATLDEVIAIGRAQVRSEVEKQIKSLMKEYETGIEITDIAFQQTRAPEQVKAAFDDATKAQQDEERQVNQAQAYARKIIPIAEGHAKRVREEAQAYKEQVILLAEGEAARFEKLLPEYRSAPQILRDRMYLTTIEDIFRRTNKILLDVEGGNNVMYLPIDQIANRPRQAPMTPELPDEDSEAYDVAPSQMTNSSQVRPEMSLKRRPSYSDFKRNQAAQ